MTIPAFFSLDIEVDDSRAQRQYARLLNRFANMRPVMEGPVKRLVLNAIRRQFDTRGAYGGKPWAPLADSTLRYKQRKGVAGKGPVRFTDRLRDSLTKIEHPDRREIVGPRSYQLISSVRSKKGFPYGATHQTGTADGHVPERQPIPDPMPDSFVRELRRLVRGHLISVQFEGGSPDEE